MKLHGKEPLTKSRDRLRELVAGATKAVGALRVERAALPLTAQVFKPEHQQKLQQAARTAALAALAQASEKAAPLTAPLATLRELDAEAERRRVTREEVATERWLRTARHVPAYTPKEYAHAPGDHRAVIGDPITNVLVNAAEQDRAQRAELTEELRRLRLASELAKAPPAELTQIATEAAAAGDGATLQAVRREHESRAYSHASDRAAVASALRQAVQAIPLPADITAELALLEEIAATASELADLRAEIDGADLSASAKARLVGQLGPDGYAARRQQEAAELQQAAQQRATQIVKNSAAELVQPTPNNVA